MLSSNLTYLVTKIVRSYGMTTQSIKNSPNSHIPKSPQDAQRSCIFSFKHNDNIDNFLTYHLLYLKSQ